MESKKLPVADPKWSVKHKITIVAMHTVMLYTSYLMAVWADEEKSAALRGMLAFLSKASLFVCIVSAIIFFMLFVFVSPGEPNASSSQADPTKDA